MKICTKCNISKDESYFSPNGKKISSWCKPCKTEIEKQRRLNKGIKPKVIPKIIGSYHKECLQCKNILHIHQYTNNKRGRLGKASYCKTCSIKKIRKAKEQDPELIVRSREYTQKYRDNHREHWRALHRLNQFNRKQLTKALSDGTVTEEFMRQLYSISTCFWCKKEINITERTAEHIIPLVMGGIHGVSNLTMACVSCNSSKHNFKL